MYSTVPAFSVFYCYTLHLNAKARFVTILCMVFLQISNNIQKQMSTFLTEDVVFIFGTQAGKSIMLMNPFEAVISVVSILVFVGCP